MSKVNINYKIQSTKNKMVINKTKGIKKDNQLFFIDNDCNMIVTFNKDSITILRDSISANLELNFKLDETLRGKYVLKEHNMLVDVKTNTVKLIMNDKRLELVYELYFDEELTDTFTFILEWSE